VIRLPQPAIVTKDGGERQRKTRQRLSQPMIGAGFPHNRVENTL
jgi:hypothetical protein